MIDCLRTRVREQPIIALYSESENELKFCNLDALFINFCSWETEHQRWRHSRQGEKCFSSLPCTERWDVQAKRLQTNGQRSYYNTISGQRKTSGDIRKLHACVSSETAIAVRYLCSWTGKFLPRCYITFFMLNSTEHEISAAHKKT